MKRHPPPGAITRARSLRRDMTKAERVMWRLLRESFPDAHFRHQVPIRHYFADFASHQFKLVIEIDGGQHNDQVDAKRTLVIEQEGYRVIRFWNNDVLGSRDGVWSMIDAALRGDHPLPASPIEGEEL